MRRRRGAGFGLKNQIAAISLTPGPKGQQGLREHSARRATKLNWNFRNFPAQPAVQKNGTQLNATETGTRRPPALS